MDKFLSILKVLFVIALITVPILLLTGVITKTFLWYLAWCSLALGLTIYVLGWIIVGSLVKDGCVECDEVGVVFIVPALFFASLGIFSFLISWFSWSITATNIVSWLIVALFIFGIIWSTFSLVTSLVRRR